MQIRCPSVPSGLTQAISSCVKEGVKPRTTRLERCRVVSLLFIGLIAGLTACGPEVKSERFGYTIDYIESGCQTGEHHFKNLSEYCEALKDDELNKGCARSDRREQFLASCIGEWDDQ